MRETYDFSMYLLGYISSLGSLHGVHVHIHIHVLWQHAVRHHVRLLHPVALDRGAVGSGGHFLRSCSSVQVVCADCMLVDVAHIRGRTSGKSRFAGSAARKWARS